MSFITKRERVFNEYDIFDLPARNEGKLKAYASCTDARAWSHFCSDKSEHLVEVIKRNNETVRPKYIPTEIIVSTLMISKNAEIARLKRKIEEFEQMLAAYDQLDLTCDQKCDIANAHAAIKAANKELDEMSLDLDLSGFTEGIDSEAFETGKSRGDELRFTGKETGKSGGDEWNAQIQSTPRMETKSNQFGASCTCDATTSAHDTRIDELQGTIISKDAKLSAMQNTIAVMENDVCEPYCVYAHIYTALEKIFGTLCQNEKYKEYLELLTAGKDTRGIDIKGKILFKLKVLEKFSLALIAPCSQEQYNSSNDCACYHAEIVTHVETTFALTSAEKPDLDSKRAHLIADIMQNEDMKEILSKESLSTKIDDERLDECYIIDTYNNIDQENLKRLKDLQANYDDLLNSYDNLKYERDCLNARFQKYAQLEKECECLQNKLREYNELWKEKEYYRNRSEDLDNLKEKFLILADETKSIETKLKAEQEINKVTSKTVDELRNENIKLNNKLTEVSLVCEKQKNSLICKLKEKECKIMCQEQQIKSLSIQIDNFLDKDTNNISTNEDQSRSLLLNDEIESQKEQIKNLKDALCCNEEEKLYYKQEFEKQLEVLNQLKFEVEDWKSKYEKEIQNNNYLEEYLKEYQIELENIKERNNVLLSTELEQKASAIENLNDIIHNKSQEISNLIDEVNKKEEENLSLLKEIQSIRDSYDQSLNLFINDRKATVDSLRSVRLESVELLQSTKSYIDIKKEISGQNLAKELSETDESHILKEIQLLRETNLENIDILRRENIEIKKSFDVAQKQSEILKMNAINQEELLKKFEQLSLSHENLLHEKATLQHDLNNKTNEANKLLSAIELTNKKSENLMDRLHESENSQKQHLKLSESYQKLVAERNDLLKIKLRLEEVSAELNKSQKIIKEQNQHLHSKEQKVSDLEKALLDLNHKYDQLQREDDILQRDHDEKYRELRKNCSELDNKIKENQNLTYNLNMLKSQEATLANNLETLKRENLSMQSDLALIKKERKELIDRLKYYENLESKYFDLREEHHEISLEKQKLQKEIELKLEDLKKLEQDNNNLNIQNENLLIHNNDLEEALIRTRNELLKSDSLTISYENIKTEIDALKSEKISSHKKICDSQDKIDELEYHIHDLNEDILARDKKIITLENYINNLKDEIRRLQSNLDKVVDSGEEMRKLSYEKLAQTQKMLEAHYSKATHNIKMEVAKLENDKSMLEEQLSMSKLITHDSSNEKHIYMSQINKLNEERKRIVSEIGQLELQIFEENILNPNNCSSEKVIGSLQKIGKYLYKNMSLEKNLRSVQNSYEILKSKADEAKTIALRERQKIIAEKEEMQKERKNIEKTLEIFKTKLEEEKTVYENKIRDLEGEMLNQALLFDKMKQMQDNEMLKLKNDKLSLQQLHDNILVQLKDLQEKLNNEYKENSIKQKAFEQATLNVKEYYKQIVSLQTQIKNLRNKPKKDYGIQTYSETTKDVATETYTGKHEKAICLEDYDNVRCGIKAENEENKNLNMDLIKCMYSNYKSKRLSLGNFEQYSIDGINLLKKNFKEVSTNTSESPPLRKSKHSPWATNSSIVNIYNTNKFTDSTKHTNDSDNYDSTNKTQSINSNLLTGLTLNSDILRSKNEFDNNASSDKSCEPVEKEMFMIYKDSQTSSDNRTYAENSLWPQKGFTNVLVERATFHNDKIYQFHTKTKENFNEIQADYDTLESTNDKSDDDSFKPKLNINLPRVYTDNISTVSLSEDDRNSINSYTRDLYVSQQRKVRSDTNINIKTSKTKKNNIIPAINLHYGDKNNNLNRNITYTVQNIEKELQLSIPNIKSNTNFIRDAPTKTHVMKTESFITEQSDDKLKNINIAQSDLLSQDKTIKENNTSNETKTTNEKIRVLKISNKSDRNIKLYKSQSDNTICVSDQRNEFKDSDVFKQLSTECSNISSSLKEPKSLIDRSVSVELDSTEHYENQIQKLNKALENLERDYKNKIDAIKVQYDSNVNLIINKHNQGVESIQSLHEERLSDIINTHENEIESLRTLGIEALRKVKRLENENHYLKSKLGSQDTNLDEVPVKIPTPEVKKKRVKCRLDDKTLTKTGVVISNLPKCRSQGPCTCTIDFNVSDTIRHMFDQVDIHQRKMAEQTYLKYIANKILNDNVEVLDAQELSFLHLKVCRQWKSRLSKEGTLQKRIESLETELINKKRQTHQHMAELDRKVKEEWQRLQEVREAVCFSPNKSDEDILRPIFDRHIIDVKSVSCNINSGERPGRSLEVETQKIQKPKRIRESNKTVLAKQDIDKIPCNHEAPTRLKRIHDRRLHRK